MNISGRDIFGQQVAKRPTFSVERASGRVTMGGRHVGTIHYPYEENRQRVARSTWKLVMAGRKIGTYRTFEQAQAAALAWVPIDDLERQVCGV